MPDTRFSRRTRLAAVLAAPIAAIALLVVAYRLTAPDARPSASGAEAVGEDDVLRVGALPVT